MKILRLLDARLEEYILVPSLVFTVILIFIQVVMRYVFQSSLSWSEELARYIFVWQTWIGASFAVKHCKHIRVEFAKNFLSPSGRKFLDVTVFLIWLGFSIFLTMKSGQLSSILFQRNQISPAMGIPMAWAYLSVPVGCGLMSLRLGQSLFLRNFNEAGGGEGA